VVGEVRPAPARVLDLGAGTGRLASPLALLGYHVTAVERSRGMADVLARRAAKHGVQIDLQRRDFLRLGEPCGPDAVLMDRPLGSFDLAIAIFTVLNYITSDDDLLLFARDVAVEPGGSFVFDIAQRRLFASALFESACLHREIEVHELAPAIFSYRDAGCGTSEGQRFDYDEVFTMRCWRDDEVLPRFAKAGLVFSKEVTGRLGESGSRWFVLRREPD
jgi:SAM-dependent methyltransferase